MDDWESNKTKFYSGGIAELVHKPTPLTTSFFRHWFGGNSSFGRAMKLLKLPYQPIPESLLVVMNGELYVDLEAEEKIIYTRTIFHYKKRQTVSETPILIIDPRRLASIPCVFNTVKILLRQAQWIAYPQATVSLMQSYGRNLPDDYSGKSIEEIDAILSHHVWPVVIAVGYLAEFYHHLVLQEKKDSELEDYIVSKITEHDWSFQAFADMQKVKTGEISFSSFIKEYGNRADQDYEITSPRWHEMPSRIEKRIKESFFHSAPTPRSESAGLTPRVQSLIRIQQLRGDARRLLLKGINALRQALKKRVDSSSTLALVTREELFGEKIEPLGKARFASITIDKKAVSGRGVGVSAGTARGTVLHIDNPTIDIPSSTIGIFPNASPMFTIQYPKCAGMIFLRGGATSHGAIVAREFHIPAIVDEAAIAIPDSSELLIQGKEGTWKINVLPSKTS